MDAHGCLECGGGGMEVMRGEGREHEVTVCRVQVGVSGSAWLSMCSAPPRGVIGMVCDFSDTLEVM